MSDKLESCKNCERPLDDDFKFCPYCGQKVNDELTLRVLFSNTINNYFSVDARFFKSFVPLMFKPGYLAKAFISGKRAMYLHPAQLYFFITIVFFALLSFSVNSQRDAVNLELKKTLSSSSKKKGTAITEAEGTSLNLDDLERLNTAFKDSINTKALDSLTAQQVDSNFVVKDLNDPEIEWNFNKPGLDSLIEANASDDEMYKYMGAKEDDNWFQRQFYSQGLKFYKMRDGGNILKAFFDAIPIALFFLLPIFALLLKILYFYRGPYSHHLVFSLYFFSFLFMVFSLLYGLNVIWEIPGALNWFIGLSTYVYLLIALKNFYGQGWFLSFFKSGVIGFIFTTIVIPTTVVLIGLMAFLFY
ncbi:MAG: DUF3667 domain-containing protein [Winogradskyella arenosi]